MKSFLVFLVLKIIAVFGTLDVPNSRDIAVERYNGLQTSSKILYEASAKSKMECTELCIHLEECRYLCVGPAEINSQGRMMLPCSLMDGNWNASETVDGPCQMYKVKNKAPYCHLIGLLANGDFTALQASSEFGTGHTVNFITMDNIGNTVDVWCSTGRPSMTLNPEWVTVDFGTEKVITAIGLKGTDAFGVYYTKIIQLLSSTDGVNWIFYEEGGNVKDFDGSTDAVTKAIVKLPFEMTTRFVKVIMKEYHWYYASSSGSLTTVCGYLEIYTCLGY